MVEGIKTSHVTTDEFIKYFDGELGEEAAQRLELHVAECDACAEWARDSWQRLVLLGDWTAQSHGEAVAEALVSHGLHRALLEDRAGVPNWKARVERWMAVSAEMAKAGMEALSQNLQPMLGQPAFAGVRGPADKPPGPTERRVAIVREGLPPGAAARLAVDDRRRRIEVRVDGLPLNQPNPLVMLAERGTGGTQIQPLARSPEGEFQTVCFEDGEPGIFLVFFEPKARS